VTFPKRRLLAAETWTAGWPKRGATARNGEIDFADARGLALCRRKVRLLKIVTGYTCRSLR